MTNPATSHATSSPTPTTRSRTQHPSAWLLAAAAFAWAGLATGALMRGTASDSEHAHHLGATAPEHGAESLAAWGGSWLLMVIAMMWPLLIPTAAALRWAVAPRWRAPAVLSFVVAFTVMWVVAGLVAHGVFAWVEPVGPAWVWPVAWLLVALAVSRWSLWRARLLRACKRPAVIAPAGRRCLLTSARAARRGWPTCAALCGPVMMAMIGTHALMTMAGGSLAVWWEQRHPRARHDAVPAGILGVTIAAAIVWPT